MKRRSSETVSGKRTAKKRSDSDEKRIKRSSGKEQVSRGSVTEDAFIAAEDEEIRRLEKLLGIGKGKRRKTDAAEKLNREFSKFEGLGEDFGSFLMDLDDMANNILGREEDNSGAEDDDSSVPDLAPEDMEQMSDEELLALDGEELLPLDLPSEAESEATDLNSEAELGSGDDEVFSDEDSGADSDDSYKKAKRAEKANKPFQYKPTKGEDIYGRVKDGEEKEASTAKYVPPARRFQLTGDSEAEVNVRRQMVGLVNKLSEQTKDSILRSMLKIFDDGSHNIANEALSSTMLSPLMTASRKLNIVPLYSAVLAGLHFIVGLDVSGFFVERVFMRLISETIASSEQYADYAAGSMTSDADEEPEFSKAPLNLLLVLVHLYNFRVIHHSLIVDLLLCLIDETVPMSSLGKENRALFAVPVCEELRLELVHCIIVNCGESLRSDDPVTLKTSIVALLSSLAAKEKAAASHNEENSMGYTRVQYLLQAATDLKNNKSRKQTAAVSAMVKNYRKWLGSMKNVLGNRVGEALLRVQVRDLLDAESKGRWWKLGASWKSNNMVSGDDNNNKALSSQREVSKDDPLAKAAARMRFNTDLKRQVFYAVMTCRDVNDAFDNLARLSVKGKGERDVVRVLLECAAREKVYNPFYTELMKMLCSQNRQHKITTQYAMWDALKALMESDDASSPSTQRRAMNLARLLSGLVAEFHLSLTVLKVVDMTELNAATVLFLSTFFLALFRSSLSEEDFVRVVDRVATSGDHVAVRDNVTFFLQTYLKKLPPGLSPEDELLVKSRKKTLLKILKDMSVLDYADKRTKKKHSDLDD